MNVAAKCFVFGSLFILFALGTEASAATMPKVQMLRVDKKVIMTPIKSYRLNFQKASSTVEKYNFSEDLNVEGVKNYIKTNKITLGCAEKVPAQIKKSCTTIKTLAFFYGMQFAEWKMANEQYLDAEKVEQLRDIPVMVVVDNLVVMLLPSKNEVLVYPSLDATKFKKQENLTTYADPSKIFFSDGKKMYLADGEKLNLLSGINPNLFQYKYIEHNYYGGSRFMNYKDNSNLYFFNKNQLYRMSVSSPDDFTLVSNNVYKDNNKVYFIDPERRVWSLRNVKALDFESADRYDDDSSPFDYTNKQNIFYEGAGALYRIDLTKYSLVGPTDYSSVIKSKTEVLYYDKVNKSISNIKGADAKTFNSVPESYGALFVDKNFVYLRNIDLTVKKLSEIDRKSFAMGFDEEFSSSQALVLTDKNGSYLLTYELGGTYERKLGIKKLPSKLNASIVYRGYGVVISKDNDNVYYSSNGQRNVLAEADANTFDIKNNIGAIYGQDKNNIYVPEGCSNINVAKLVGADVSSFEIVRVGNWDYFARDMSNVWYYDSKSCRVVKIEGADPATFDFEAYLASKAVVE